MKISIFQVAYKNLLRKKTPEPPDHPRHRPGRLGPGQPVRLQQGLRDLAQPGHRQPGLPDARHRQGLPLRGGDPDAQGRDRPPVPEGGHRRRRSPGSRRSTASPRCSCRSSSIPNKGESGGMAVYLGVDPKTFPRMKSFLKFKQGGWFTDPDAARGRHRLRGGRARTARGRGHVPHPGEERRGQGRRRPGADGDPGRRDDLPRPSAPSRGSSGSRTSSPASGSRSRRTPTSPSSRRGCTSFPTSRSSA